MIRNQKIDEKYTIVWQEPLLQILMGQWLCILPSTSKKYSLLHSYQIPKKADEYLLEGSISRKNQEQIDQEIVKLLNLFELQDYSYELSKWDPENHLFSCYMKDAKKVATIQFLFHDFMTYPSDFVVFFEGIKTKYHFITVKDQKENRLVSLERQEKNGMIEEINKEFYQLKLPNIPLSISIQYRNQLEELNNTLKMIDIDKLKEMIETKNLGSISLLDLYQKLNKTLLKPIDEYHHIIMNNKEGKLDFIVSKDHLNILRINDKIIKIEKGQEKKDISYDSNKMKKIKK